MNKKFRKAVNAPHRVMGRVSRAIEAVQPQTVGGMALREAGLVTADMSRFLLWAAKYITLDNHLLRGTEKLMRKITGPRGDNKKATTKSVGLSYLMYYMMMAGMIMSGKGHDDNNGHGTETASPQPVAKTEQVIRETRGIDNFKIKPNVSKDEWNKQIDAILPYILMETILSEGFVEEMYSDVGAKSGYLTIGSGYMVGKVRPKGKKDHAILKEKKDFFKKILGRPLVNGTSITPAENQKLISAWYKERIFPQLQRLLTSPVDADVFIELSIAAFNRGEGIFNARSAGHKMMEHVNAGAKKDVIANDLSLLFVKGNEGLRPKYGVAAHRLLGNITDADVLNSVANAVYRMSADMIWTKGNKLKKGVTDNIVAEFRNIKNADIRKNGRTYQQRPVREYMSPDQVETILKGDLFAGPLVDFSSAVTHAESKPDNVLMAEKLNEEGEAFYDSDNYPKAIQKFNAALDANPRLYIVYSNLSITYYKQGDYKSGLAVVQDLLNSEYVKDMPDNVKAYSYYNAALCYEGLGDNAIMAKDKKSCYERARKNAAIAERLLNVKYPSFDARLTEKMHAVENNKLTPKLDGKTKSGKTQKPVKKSKSSKASKAPAKKKVNKRHAFNAGAKKLGNRAHSADLDITNLLNSGHDMA